MSAQPHGIFRLTLGGFSWILIFEDFSKICREIWGWFECGKKNGYFSWSKCERIARVLLQPFSVRVLSYNRQCIHFVDILNSSATKCSIDKHAVCRKVVPTSASLRPHPAVQLSLCRRTSIINGNWHWITHVTYRWCRFSFKVHLGPE